MREYISLALNLLLAVTFLISLFYRRGDLKKYYFFSGLSGIVLGLSISFDNTFGSASLPLALIFAFMGIRFIKKISRG